MTKKMKDHIEEQASNNFAGNNLATEKLTGENNTENPTNQVAGEEDIESSENTSDETMQKDQSEKAEESKTPVDYERVIAEWKDKYIRLSAEFDNYRKRTLKEKIELTKYANEDFLISLLPVVDDFEHGLKTLEQATDIEAVKLGIEHIYNKFKDFLSQKGLKEIEVSNGDFNTDFHEAITKTPVQEKEKSGKIIDTIQKGYMLDEKVIRHSKVVIGE
jgi:molecular chaperone GrpE